MLNKGKEKQLSELDQHLLLPVQEREGGKVADLESDNNLIQVIVNDFEHKLLLLNMAEKLGNVSKACKMLGISRNTYYRYKAAFARDGYNALMGKNQRQQDLKHVVDMSIEQADLAWTMGHLGKKGILDIFVDSKSDTLAAVKPSHNTWMANKHSTIKDFSNNYVVKHGANIRVSQAVDRIETNQQSGGSVERIRPDLPTFTGIQDTIYAGAFKDVGLVYLQVFVDDFSQYTFAKFYLAKTAVTAVDLLKHEVLPFLREKNLPLLSILTNYSSQYCGCRDNHLYQQYLALNNIAHKKTKIKSLDSNCLCKKFYQEFLIEFKPIILNNHENKDLSVMQLDLANWLMHYNTNRPNSNEDAPMDKLQSAILQVSRFSD
jgi:DNA-binding protein Fis